MTTSRVTDVLAVIKREAARRTAALAEAADASAVLRETARKVVRTKTNPHGPIKEVEFAKLAGVDRTTVRAWLRKQPTNR